MKAPGNRGLRTSARVPVSSVARVARSAAKDETSRQLSLIGEMAALFDEADVPFWLSGGWAIDFHAGRITRSHSDLDLVVRLEDRLLVTDLLDGAGFGMAPLGEREGLAWYERDGLRLELTLITPTANKETVTPGYEDWPWPLGSFTETRLTFSGITVRAISVEGILDMKRGWAEHFGRLPRPYDLDDIELLEGLI